MSSQTTTPKVKPLHRDLSFWIVVVVASCTLNVIQLSFGLPWFLSRWLATRPAPRAAAFMGTVSALNSNRQPGLDYGKKTYPWQAPSFMPELLNTPPQVVIIPSEYQAPSGGWTIPIAPDNAIGIRVPAAAVLQAAYAGINPSRIIFPQNLPAGTFDFVANLPAGGLEALQQEIEKKWGLVGTRLTINTNVLVLKVDHDGAPGLKPGASPNGAQPGGFVAKNGFVLHNSSVFNLANLLESMLRCPILDQTGLTGSYDVLLPNLPPGSLEQDHFEPARKYLLEEYGLLIIPTNAPVEFLVLKKGGI